MPGFWGTGDAPTRTPGTPTSCWRSATRFAETDASSWDPALHLAVPARPAHPDRHRPGRDRPQLPGRDRRGRRRRATPCRRSTPRSATGSPTPTARPGLRETIAAARRALFAESAERGAQRPVPAAARADPRRPARGPARRTRSSSPTSAGTRTAWPSATRCPPRGGSSPRAAPRRWASARRPRVGVQIAAARPGRGRADRRRRHERPAAGACRWPSSRALPVIFLVMNNRAHGTIADLQAANFGRSYGCEFRDPDGNPYSPDFAAFGRACGADGYTVDSAGRPRRGAARRHRSAADRRCSTCRWSTSRCPPPVTGTSRTSTRASSSRTSVNRPNPDPGTGEAGRRRARGGRPWQTGCSSSTDRT